MDICWVIFVSEQSVGIHNGRRHTKKFPEMRTCISTGCSMAALLLDVLALVLMHMCGKWLHIAAFLLCARAVWVKMYPKLWGTFNEFEERPNIQFMCKLWKNPTEISQALKTVYWDNALKNSCVWLVQPL